MTKDMRIMKITVLLNLKMTLTNDYIAFLFVEAFLLIGRDIQIGKGDMLDVKETLHIMTIFRISSCYS